MKKRGHAVKILSSGRGLKNLSQYFEVEEIAGLTFHYAKNEVQLIPTIIDNTIKLPKFQKNVEKVMKIAEQFQPQIVFSDFEPISCLVANLKKLPLISIDNQHRLTNTKIKYPKKYKFEAQAAIAVTRMMIYNSRACLVITFDQQAKITNPKTFLFPPILRQEVLNAKATQDDYILVYIRHFTGIDDFKKFAEIFSSHFYFHPLVFSFSF